MSPTQRTLAKLRKEGWLAAVCERWNPHAKVRQDLFGFIDVLAVKDNTVLAIQTTSGNNVSARIRKILTLPAVRLWLDSPTRLLYVHGWAKRGLRGKRKTWTCREVVVQGPYQLAVAVGLMSP